VTASGETACEYDYTGGEAFRVERYAPEYSGFDSRPLDDDLKGSISYPIVDSGQTTC